MKVLYETTRRENDGLYPKTYKEIEPETFCCKETKTAWIDRAIVFGEVDYAGLNVDNNVNISRCRPFPEGAAWDEYAIKYCPFCGEKIETEEIKK